jgi:hypothetical protein
VGAGSHAIRHAQHSTRGARRPRCPARTQPGVAAHSGQRQWVAAAAGLPTVQHNRWGKVRGRSARGGRPRASTRLRGRRARGAGRGRTWICWMTFAKGCDALAENCVVFRMGALPTFMARMTTLSGFLAAAAADLSAGCWLPASLGACPPSSCPSASPAAGGWAPPSAIPHTKGTHVHTRFGVFIGVDPTTNRRFVADVACQRQAHPTGPPLFGAGGADDHRMIVNMPRPTRPASAGTGSAAAGLRVPCVRACVRAGGRVPCVVSLRPAP